MEGLERILESERTPLVCDKKYPECRTAIEAWQSIPGSLCRQRLPLKTSYL
jgi:hypothetical protein